MSANIPFIKQALLHVHEPYMKPTLGQHCQQMRSYFACVHSFIVFTPKMNWNMFSDLLYRYSTSNKTFHVMDITR